MIAGIANPADVELEPSITPGENRHVCVHPIVASSNLITRAVDVELLIYLLPLRMSKKHCTDCENS